MSLGPQIPRNPLELLENDGLIERSLIAKHYAPVAGAALGFTGVVVTNYFTKRPVMSGIQKHVMWTLGLAAICKWMDTKTKQFYAERDAIYRHYVQLHPEDFPNPEPKKFKDVLENWCPNR